MKKRTTTLNSEELIKKKSIVFILVMDAIIIAITSIILFLIFTFDCSNFKISLIFLVPVSLILIVSLNSIASDENDGISSVLNSNFESINLVNNLLSTQMYKEVVPLYNDDNDNCVSLTSNVKYYAIIKNSTVIISIQFDDEENFKLYEKVQKKYFTSHYKIK